MDNHLDLQIIGNMFFCFVPPETYLDGKDFRDESRLASTQTNTLFILDNLEGRDLRKKDLGEILIISFVWRGIGLE